MQLDPRIIKQVEQQPYPLLFATISGAHLWLSLARLATTTCAASTSCPSRKWSA